MAMLAALALSTLAACDQASQVDKSDAAAADSSKTAAPVSFERETEQFAFSYEYPQQAAALPQLAAMLDAERTRSLAELEKQTSAAQAEAKQNDFPFNPHMLGISWTVTGENDRLLALLATISSYSGGAHGNTGFEALIWDKMASRRVALDAIFTDLPGALAPLRQQYCDALNAERASRRGEYLGGADDMFNTCPPNTELVIIPFASGSTGFDRLMFIAAAYVAGPYAEGPYEISLPLPTATLDKLKAEYRAAFVAAAP